MTGDHGSLDRYLENRRRAANETDQLSSFRNRRIRLGKERYIPPDLIILSPGKKHGRGAVGESLEPCDVAAVAELRWSIIGNCRGWFRISIPFVDPVTGRVASRRRGWSRGKCW